MTRQNKSTATIRRRKQGSVIREILFRHRAPSGDDNLESDDEEEDEFDRRGLKDDAFEGAPALQVLMSSQRALFLGLLAFRCVNSMVIQTSFVPDEYWQSLEVAHKMAFGYGYLTWEWVEGIRGYTHPLLFAFLYKILGMFHLDNRVLLIKFPRLLQGMFAAVGDLYLYKLSYKLSGRKVAEWSLLCQLTSWFTFYSAPRTLSNSLETVLTTVGLYYFPWPSRNRKAQWKYISLAGLAIVMRPTAAILWLPLFVWHFFLYQKVAWKVIKQFTKIGFLILIVSSIVDRIFYGKWVCTHYNFLRFNVLSNMGTFYGSHPWHWYMTQGLPVILGTHLLPFFLGARKAMEPVLLAIIAWTTFVYSSLGHKEFRFLFPILPLAMHVCGRYLHSFTNDTDTDCSKQNGGDGTEHSRPSQTATSGTSAPVTLKQVIVIVLILSNLPIAMYTSLLHQRGTLDVMKYLHDETYAIRNDSMNVLFLMPCHSTPYYSYLHRNISLRFLTCEPNLSNKHNYTDEADLFYQNSTGWLQQDVATSPTSLPTHLVMFNVLIPGIAEFLQQHQYIEKARFFHAHIREGRVGSHVVVMTR